MFLAEVETTELPQGLQRVGCGNEGYTPKTSDEDYTSLRSLYVFRVEFVILPEDGPLDLRVP